MSTIYFWPTAEGYSATEDYDKIDPFFNRQTKLGGPLYCMMPSKQALQDYVDKECVPGTILKWTP